MKEEILKVIEKFNNLDEESIAFVNKLLFSFPDKPIKDYDIILVLNSSAIKRVEKAVEVYTIKKVPIIISGTNMVAKEKLLEDERYYLYLVSHGVEEEDIIIENESHNTKENIINSLKILENKKITNCLIITSSQHMFRALQTIKKEYQGKINFIPCVCYATKVPKDWYNYKESKDIVKGELMRLIKYDLI